MSIVIVVSNIADWPLSIAGVKVVKANDYLTSPEYSKQRGLRIFNLCRNYRYQSEGYYVSLLSVARGHRPFPSLDTILGMRSRSLVGDASREMDDAIEKALEPLKSNEFTLSIYFGRNLARRYDRLALKLFNLFPAPLLRATFVKTDRWNLQNIQPIPAREIPEHHQDFVMEAATEYLSKPIRSRKPRRTARYDLAILTDPTLALPPSDEGAIKRFIRAAERIGVGVELITKDDFSRLGEFDALFIRETTAVNHHTYRFAQRAAGLGLVVVDDPTSIIRCSNKVYLAEVLEAHKIPTPSTRIGHRGNLEALANSHDFPCVLKYPDSSFSQGVLKVSDVKEFLSKAGSILSKTDLFVVQEFLPTEFDWRIGVWEGRALFACKYGMAPDHWQVVQKESEGRFRFGRVVAVPLHEVPHNVLSTAIKACRLIGDGLYGVDIKSIGKKALVIEINDNPNIDSDVEDLIIKDELYRRIMGGLFQRVELTKARQS
jgi:glutathione synthase/RimK-type ligase-like ATP-grasp enzyme